MAVVIVCTVCLINLLLWFLFFKKFKKLFSTDDIIENTRTELNRMILDVNRNAERNITLIEAKINDLKVLINQADTHISLMKAEVEKTRMADSYKSTLKNVINSNKQKGSYKVEAYLKNSSKNNSRVNADAAFEIVKEFGDKAENQPSLFSNTNSKHFESSSAGFTENTAGAENQQENAYTEVPVFGHNVHMAEEPIVIKKSFNQEVNERFMRGESVEEIAASLSRSVTEVQFALDMTE